MPSEKHQQKAREVAGHCAGCGCGVCKEIAAALEATERDTAIRCAEIAIGEQVNAGATVQGERTRAYNTACVFVDAKIRAEFGITEKEATR